MPTSENTFLRAKFRIKRSKRRLMCDPAHLHAVSFVFSRNFARKNVPSERGRFSALSRQTSDIVAFCATMSEFNTENA